MGLVFKEFICKRVPPGNEIINGVTLDQSIGYAKAKQNSTKLFLYRSGLVEKLCEEKFFKEDLPKVVTVVCPLL